MCVLLLALALHFTGCVPCASYAGQWFYSLVVQACLLNSSASLYLPLSVHVLLGRKSAALVSHWQVVTPASTAPARAADSSTAASTLLPSSVAQAAVQQPQVIGVRTLLEFVAWLVCSSVQAGAVGAQKGKQVSQIGMNSRQGAVFLTEELSDVGIAVRRLQVSRAAHVVHVRNVCEAPKACLKLLPGPFVLCTSWRM